jgi:1,5-anhydro-D-fructose reductase (1,5-anhydro-D-mannitol-forming)
MRNKIRYGITGFGIFAESTIMPAILASANSELVAIQKRSKEEAEKKAKQFNIPLAFDSVEELVNHPDVDAIYAVSSNSVHARDVIISANAGKHAVTEKPMAMNSKEAEEMIEICKDKNVKLMVAQMARFSPIINRLKELINAGTIGRINFAKADFSFDGKSSKRTWLSDTKIAGSGPTFDIGVHCLDTLRFILEDEVISVKSQLSPIPDSEKTELTSILALKFLKGITASIYTSFEAPFTRIFLEIVGETGIISVENFTSSNFTASLKIEKGKNGILTETMIEKIQVPNIYEKEISHFSDCIINNKEPFVPGEEGLKNQLILDKAIKVI